MGLPGPMGRGGGRGGKKKKGGGSIADSSKARKKERGEKKVRYPAVRDYLRGRNRRKKGKTAFGQGPNSNV